MPSIINSRGNGNHNREKPVVDETFSVCEVDCVALSLLNRRGEVMRSGPAMLTSLLPLLLLCGHATGTQIRVGE